MVRGVFAVESAQQRRAGTKDEIFLFRLLRDNRAMPSFRPVEVNIIDPIAVCDHASGIPPAIGKSGTQAHTLSEHQGGASQHSGRELHRFTVRLPINVPAEIATFYL